jgi:hypothetical protein
MSITQKKAVSRKSRREIPKKGRPAHPDENGARTAGRRKTAFQGGIEVFYAATLGNGWPDCYKKQCPAEIRVRSDMERENISVDIITVHGHEHVVVINGMAFELDPGMFDPTIHKIEWVAGQGVIYWEDGRENTLFGKDGYDVHIAPLVRAFGEEQRRVEDNVIILDAERRQRTYATAKQRANLLSQIREVEEKMARSTQAILAAQLAGKVPEGEDVHHFLSNYTRKLELRAQLTTLDADM